MLHSGENGESFMRRIPNPEKMKKIKDPTLSFQELKTTKIKVELDLDIELLEHLKKLAKKTHQNYKSLLHSIVKNYLHQQAA